MRWYVLLCCVVLCYVGLSWFVCMYVCMFFVCVCIYMIMYCNANSIFQWYDLVFVVIFVFVFVFVFVFTCLCLRDCVCVCVCVYVFVFVFTWLCLWCRFVCIRWWFEIRMCVCVCLCVCLYVCVSMHVVFVIVSMCGWLCWHVDVCTVYVCLDVVDVIDNDRNCDLREGAAKELSKALCATSQMEELYLGLVALPPSLFSLFVFLSLCCVFVCFERV